MEYGRVGMFSFLCFRTCDCIIALTMQIWNMMEGKDLFTDLKDEQGYYNGNAHLAQMIAFLGPPPASLLQWKRKLRKVTFTPKIKNPQGQTCENAFQYFGGPFFDDDGKI